MTNGLAMPMPERWGRIAVVAFGLVLLVQQAKAQDVHTLRINVEGKTRSEALNAFSDVSSHNVTFSPDQLTNTILHGVISGDEDAILSAILTGTGLQYQMIGDQYVIFRPSRDLQRHYKRQVSGYVEDAGTGERLIDAYISEIGTTNAVSTNTYGYFSLDVASFKPQLEVSYLGYASDTINTEELEPLQVVALEKSLTLEEVVIYSEWQDVDRLGDADRHRLLPGRENGANYLGGEFDLQQAMNDLAGITSGADGVGGVNVRGGSSDQNLVRLDGVTLYSPSHAIGITSVINPLLIRDATLIKAPFDARYAGRLSSTLDVHTIDGNMHDLSFTGSVGTLSASALLEGPLVKDKVSFAVAGRTFVPSAYLRSLSSAEKDRSGLQGETRYTYGDVNLKINGILNNKNRLYLSLYYGYDSYADITEEVTYDGLYRLTEVFDKKLRWGNTSGSLRWNHIFGDRTFSNLTLTATDFKLESLDNIDFVRLEDGSAFSGYDQRQFTSHIRDFGISWDFDHRVNQEHQIEAGIAVTHHYFQPKSIVFNDQSQLDEFIIDEGTLDDALFSDLFKRSWEFGLYAEDNLSIGSALHMHVGLHLAAFATEDKLYLGPQPRLRVTYDLSEKYRLHLAGGRSIQYLHLLTTSGIGLPTDLWVPSTGLVKPQSSWHWSAGMTVAPLSNLRLGWTFFYKDMRNLTFFREGASFLFEGGTVEAGLIDAANWESKVVQGDGRAYGSEWTIDYAIGRFNTEFHYTWSKTTRQVDAGSNINSFPFRYDRPHSLGIGGTYRIGKKFSISVDWTYASGNPITIAEGKYLTSGLGLIPNINVLTYGDRNGYRLPDYHRLDIGGSVRWARSKASHELGFSIYNLYNRENTFYVTLEATENGQSFTGRQYTVLPFIPSIRYTIKI